MVLHDLFLGSQRVVKRIPLLLLQPVRNLLVLHVSLLGEVSLLHLQKRDCLEALVVKCCTLKKHTGVAKVVVATELLPFENGSQGWTIGPHFEILFNNYKNMNGQY